jgi:hypothetical protein
VEVTPPAARAPDGQSVQVMLTGWPKTGSDRPPSLREEVIQSVEESQVGQNRVLGVRVDGFSWLYATNNEVAAA